MLKVQYPEDCDQLHQSYEEVFAGTDKAAELEALFQANKFEPLREYSFNRILTADIETLFKISELWNSIVTTADENVTLKKIFNYDHSDYGAKYQSKIAQFFIKNKNTIKLETCYFCNLEFINAFPDISDYVDELDFINRASQDELKEIDGIGKVTAEEIFRQRGEGFPDFDSLDLGNNEALKENIKNFSCSEKFYFTLDHVLNKAKHPITSLSLYNFVPCCYPCNSKFKRDRQLISDDTDIFLSPTSTNNTIEKDLCFEFLFHAEKKDFLSINSVDDFSVSLKSLVHKPKYEKYEKTFKLNARYKSHKRDALELINKNRRYSDKKIQQVSELLNITPDDIKYDIFGKELFNESSCDSPKSKYIKDIAENIGLKK